MAEPQYQQNSRKKVGLALSGGTALGLAHIGVLESFAEHKIPVDFISGTSAGALVAALYAFGVPLDQMRDEAGQFSWLRLSRLTFSKKGIISGRAIEDIIKKYLDQAKIEDAKIPLAIVATDLNSGKLHIMRKGDLAQAVSASACIPGLFTPVEIDGRTLVDGGLIETIPFSPLRAMGAEVIIGVHLGKERHYQPPKDIVDVVTSSFDIMNNHLTRASLNQADILIEPLVGRFHLTDFSKYHDLILEGYKAANFKISEIRNAIQYTQTPVNLGLWQRLKNFFQL